VADEIEPKLSPGGYPPTRGLRVVWESVPPGLRLVIPIAFAGHGHRRLLCLDEAVASRMVATGAGRDVANEPARQSQLSSPPVVYAVQICHG
jgi:hypothetical protein